MYICVSVSWNEVYRGSITVCVCVCVLTSEADAEMYMKFMKSHCCYEAIPTSCKLVIFDTTLQVRVQGPVTHLYVGTEQYKIIWGPNQESRISVQ